MNTVFIIFQVIARIFHFFFPIKKNRVVMWSYHYTQYGCNPKYITEYILKNYNSIYDIYWIMNKKSDKSLIPENVHIIRSHSFLHFYYINTAEFVITNCRSMVFFWKKRKGQKYIMTWHGGICLKKIEKDAANELPEHYIKMSIYDGKICDLIPACSKFQEELIKKSYYYSGEILCKGAPRNDVFFDSKCISEIKQKIKKRYSISDSDKIVLYAPTFRSDLSISLFKLDWSSLVPNLSKMLGGDIQVLLRLHPNMLDAGYNSNEIFDSLVIDVTDYPDMQELLCITDLLITDYSSTMFDVCMLQKPCILYAPDHLTYDRGFYFPLKSLPFPLAEDQKALTHIISEFKENEYFNKVKSFINNNICIYDEGYASKEIVNWMIEHHL